ncbi:glycosyltransferase family 2 protein [Butyricimonas paravirosa]|uniref:glycosyltransferase family 2 protein n=1 Tax=Butyricimonas paravirosa TaxID=1472417 RepID=UPI0022E25EEC|nr:glycosyltransferase family 2 protein [Butyricimonas paravirosa]
MSQNIDVSIIIVSYNTREFLRECLYSLFEKTKSLSFEVIVVDNESSDGSVQMIQELFPQVTILNSGENVGFGRANNIGIKEAQGRNVFLLNPDTILLNNAIKILSDFLDSHDEVAVCGGNLYNVDKEPTHSFLRYLPSVFGELDQLTGYKLSKWCYGKSFEFNHNNRPLHVGYITGADMMIKKIVLDEVGCFDPDFFMYFEETELTYRIRKAGYKIMSVPEACIVHLEGKSHSLKENRERMFLTSRRLYYKKTLRCNLIFYMCQLLYGLNICIHILYYFFFHRDKEQLKIWKYRWIIF